MKKLHYILILALILATITVFTSCRKNNNSDDMRKNQDQQQVLLKENDIEDSPSPSPDEAFFNFLVRLENNTLTLYEINEEEYYVIKSLNIDTSYYPYEDIQELNKGIPAYSKERGFEILENFIN